ncbi:MAG: LamG-like jellyroll fold domain-containing protein, partial [Polyangia bacterium]
MASSTLSTTNVGTYTRSTTNTGSTTTTSTQTTTSVTTWPWPYFASNSTAAQTSYEVGYWNLDEATPNTDYNDLWKNHDGTGTGMSTATSYWTGRSAKFQSAQGNPATSYISMGAGTIEAPLKSTTGFTVSLWIYPGSPSGRQTVLSYDGTTTDGGTTTSTNGGFRLSISPPENSSNYICADNNNSSPSVCQQTGNTNDTVLVAVTITNPTWTLYQYDIQKGGCTASIATGSFPTPYFTSGGTWRLGASGTNKQYGFVGPMDEVKFWNYPLSQTDLNNLCTCNMPSCNYVIPMTASTTVTGTYTSTISATQTASGVTTKSGTQTASGVTTQTATQTASGVTTQSGTQTASGVTTQSGTQTASGVTTKSGTQTASGVTTQSGTQTASGVTTQSGTQTASGVTTQSGTQTASGVTTQSGTQT